MPSKDNLTSIFGMIFASDMFKNAIERIQTNGFSFESIWDLAGAVGVVLWAYFTNKS